jgi:4-hydroxy-tetrahydrodipicolinate synthase
VGIPIIVQDYPPVSGFFMEPALLVRIAREVPKATLFKLEDAPTPPKVAEIRARSNGLEIGILGGLGGLYFLEELVAGANGAMTGFPYPEMLVEVLCLFRAGKLEEAAETFYRYVPIMRFAYQQGVGVAIRKEILRRRGVLRNATIRAPGPVMDGAMLRSLDYLLASMRRQGVPWIS